MRRHSTAPAGFNYSVRDGGTGVLIVQHPEGLEPVHYLNNRRAGLNGASYFDLTSRRLAGTGPGRGGNAKKVNNIVYSQYMTRNLKNNYRTGTFFFDKWEDVVAKLREFHPGDPRVAVYPYAGKQHQEIELDG